MRSRPARTFVASILTVFVFLLFAFPNYCEKCSYRDVARALSTQQKSLLPPCCAGRAEPATDGGADDPPAKPSGGKHVRYSFCITKSLSSVAEQRDVLREIRLSILESPFRLEEGAFRPRSPVFPHKHGRAPPA